MLLFRLLKDLFLHPKSTWPKIALQPMTAKGIMRDLILPLALIPAIIIFLWMSWFTPTNPIFGAEKLGWPVIVLIAVSSLISGILIAPILATILDALASRFGGERNFVQSFKLAAFSSAIIPLFGLVMLKPEWSNLYYLGFVPFLYLLYLGMTPLKLSSPGRTTPYFIVTSLLFFIATTIVHVVVGFMTGILALAITTMVRHA